MLDDEVIEHFREIAEASGTGYQTMVNTALRASVAKSQAEKVGERPVTASVLRTILREELGEAR